MHHKPYGGRALHGPTGGAYSTPPSLLTGLRGGPPGRGEGREGMCREEWGGEGWKEKGGEGKDGEKGWGGKGRQGKGG